MENKFNPKDLHTPSEGNVTITNTGVEGLYLSNGIVTNSTFQYTPAMGSMLRTDIYGDRIEIIYDSSSFYTVYKVIYSCVDGKWNVSDPIPGTIIPAQAERFEFETPA
jgi:hypothetical protein